MSLGKEKSPQLEEAEGTMNRKDKLRFQKASAYLKSSATLCVTCATHSAHDKIKEGQKRETSDPQTDNALSAVSILAGKPTRLENVDER